ncbi:hypothetical protein AYI69_g6122 [Smittium culicis]|uniref:RING-type domain-containing protein n=1 Tax=Smittium culicis TaxID=133412 RepID=A0A1R1Y176_9FUNG|nr:hypothetical protein AYI69_g6122 [Smittium culicis]
MPCLHKIANKFIQDFANCGHVFCLGCVDKFIVLEKKCFLCSKPTAGNKRNEQGVINLVSEGTGFAGGGGQAEASRYDLGFNV